MKQPTASALPTLPACMVIRKTDSGDYRISFRVTPFYNRHRAEEGAAYTDDKLDAYNTAVAMAEFPPLEYRQAASVATLPEPPAVITLKGFAAPSPLFTKEALAMLNQAAFLIESVAHIQGHEHALLPISDALWALIPQDAHAVTGECHPND